MALPTNPPLYIKGVTGTGSSITYELYETFITNNISFFNEIVPKAETSTNGFSYGTYPSMLDFLGFDFQNVETHTVILSSSNTLISGAQDYANYQIYRNIYFTPSTNMTTSDIFSISGTYNLNVSANEEAFVQIAWSKNGGSSWNEIDICYDTSSSKTGSFTISGLVYTDDIRIRNWHQRTVTTTDTTYSYVNLTSSQFTSGGVGKTIVIGSISSFESFTTVY